MPGGKSWDKEGKLVELPGAASMFLRTFMLCFPMGFDSTEIQNWFVCCLIWYDLVWFFSRWGLLKIINNVLLC
jgi:hypothetical protein